MYFETGLGQAFKPRKKPPKQPPKKSAKPQPKVPADRFHRLFTIWNLSVPFRQDLKVFRQEVVNAIMRHVAAEDRTKIDPLLLAEELQDIHDHYRINRIRKSAEPDFVTVTASIGFKKNNHTDLYRLLVSLPET